MQKLLRRTQLVKRQAARRKAADREKQAADNRKLQLRNTVESYKPIRELRRASQLTRQEDWLLGPLAPKRDVGDQESTYGALPSSAAFFPKKPADKIKDWGIVEGDRVVIIQDGHPDQGRIGKVKTVEKEQETVTIDGFNLANIRIQDAYLVNEIDKTPVRPLALPLPLSAVRLVAPLPHPETGVLRDVIIKELKLKRTSLREIKGEDPQSRFIAGLKPATLIPYPEKEEETFEDNDCDTLRIEVEERTWVPTLLTPPMPHTIIDELRGKYSKFRDRHDDAFIAKKMQEDAEAEERKNSIRKMMTPLKELHRKERAEKKSRGKPQLDEQTLARIGEVMARNMPSSDGEQAATRV